MDEQVFRLSGFVPMPMSGPCFTTPVFTGPTNAPWLQDFRADDRIDAFLALDPGDPRVLAFNSKVERRVGGEVLFGFRLISAEPVFGTRKELALPLTEAFAGLEGRPNTQRAIARFLRNEQLLALVDPKPVPVVPPRQRTPNILVLGDIAADRRPLFDAAVFSVLACGANPVTDLDQSVGETTHLEFVRRNSSNASGLICLLGPEARNNLAFELGLYLGASHMGARSGRGTERRAQPLILSDEPYSYQRDFSNLAGMDIQAHHGEAVKIVRAVRNYLVDNFNRKAVGGAALARDYNTFRRALIERQRQQGVRPDQIIMADFRRLATDFIDQ